jgi:hypothetical protein
MQEFIGISEKQKSKQKPKDFSVLHSPDMEKLMEEKFIC